MQDIQNLIGKIKDFDAVSAEVISDFEANSNIKMFIQKHQLSLSQVIDNANTFYEYLRYTNEAPVNPQIEGHLFLNDYGNVEFGYRYTSAYQKLLELKQYIECLYMDEQLLKADIKDFSAQVDSQAVIRAIQVVKAIQTGAHLSKGLFISGENGVGKTHMLAAIAKEFCKKETKVILVFVPELIRTLKQNSYEANTLVRKLQNTPILMLDDLGAEMQTSFSRDEILLPILNSRMNTNKLTFFSSNFSLKDLEHHFTKTQYGENEPIKAKRMIERIEALSDYVGLVGANHRRK